MSNLFNILLHVDVDLFAGFPINGNSGWGVRAGLWFMTIIRLTHRYNEVRVA